jgi:hypothetical protein
VVSGAYAYLTALAVAIPVIGAAAVVGLKLLGAGADTGRLLQLLLVLNPPLL